MDLISERVLSAIADQYGSRPEPVEQLFGGEESTVYRLKYGGCDVVLRMSPEWRTVAELAWSYRRASEAAQEIPEIISPILTHDGRQVIAVDGRPVSLFPFVPGMRLDRESCGLRDQAAGLLARIHRFFLGSTGFGARPPTSPNAYVMRKPKTMSPRLVDPDLDQYLAKGRTTWNDLRAPIHGDFFRGNLLCREERILGLVDWDDCRIGGLHEDLAWSVWEFAKEPSAGDRLEVDRAMRFVDAYRRLAGPVQTDDLGFLVPFIRKHLRYEIGRELAAKELDECADDIYIELQTRAFQNLQGIELPN